jgi:hypothetical protein
METLWVFVEAMPVGLLLLIAGQNQKIFAEHIEGQGIRGEEAVADVAVVENSFLR